MTTKDSKTYAATIFIAGDVNDARRLLRDFCMEGLCVTVTSTTFIYTGGAEEGAAIGLINYPRFPKPPKEIWKTAERLAKFLIKELSQHSATVVANDKSRWYSRREAK